MGLTKTERERISRLRREAAGLLAQCERLVSELLHPGAMMAASFYQMYKKCGRAGCRCTQGELHGPFPVISMSRKGRRSTRSVPRDRQEEVRRLTEGYRAFQRKRLKLRSIFSRIERIVEDIRDAHLVELP